jgi:Flp pilus assembly pilin Flp
MNATNRARAVLVRLITEDHGQDLIEYALLTGIAVLVAAVALPAASALGDMYEAWNHDVQELWEPPPPGSAG